MHFTRTSLATELADAMQGRMLFNDASNGLFLSAPRRTGKSTFLRQDLQPELERRGVVVVYVDLWAQPQRDPGEIIAEAIGLSLQAHQGLITKAARAAGLESISIAGALKIDARKIGQAGGTTLAHALQALHELSKSPVALVIDEALHALTSETGENVMMALKSARDQMNAPGDVQLMLIMSGSDRDKLLRLVNGNAAPFFGSTIKHLPELGTDFVAHLAHLVEAQRHDLMPVDRAKLYEAFVLFGHRPQFFIDALGQALSPFHANAARMEDAAIALARQRQQEDRQQMARDYLGLRPMEQAVLWRMLEQGPRFRPYDADALRFYAEKTGAETTTKAQAQKAIEGLRSRQPSIIWKSARSEYAIDDIAMHHWYTQRVQAGTWPPADEEFVA